MYRTRRQLTKAADDLMSLVAEAGGAESDYFASMFGSIPLHTYRPIHYPKRVADIPENGYLPDGSSEWIIRELLRTRCNESISMRFQWAFYSRNIELITTPLQ